MRLFSKYSTVGKPFVCWCVGGSGRGHVGAAFRLLRNRRIKRNCVCKVSDDTFRLEVLIEWRKTQHQQHHLPPVALCSPYRNESDSDVPPSFSHNVQLFLWAELLRNEPGLMYWQELYVVLFVSSTAVRTGKPSYSSSTFCWVTGNW